MKFEVLKVAMMKNPVPRIWHHVGNTGVYFVGTCCLHHQSSPWTSTTVPLRTLIQLVLQVCWHEVLTTHYIGTNYREYSVNVRHYICNWPWWYTTQGTLSTSGCV